MTAPTVKVHLKDEFQRELDLARGPIRLGNDAGGGADSAAVEDDLIRVREIGVVENVEHLRPELQIHFLGNRELLEQRRVESGQARPS
jgi:hypothetical protein